MTLERKIPEPGEKWNCRKHGHNWVDASRPMDTVKRAVMLCTECKEVWDTTERRKTNDKRSE